MLEIFSMKPKKKTEKETDPRILGIADKLKKLRIKAGFTSYENFAIEHGLNRMQYWRLEKGVNCRLKSLLKVLDIHQISMKEFFKDIKG